MNIHFFSKQITSATASEFYNSVLYHLNFLTLIETDHKLHNNKKVCMMFEIILNLCLL